MKVSTSWLGAYVPLKTSVADLAEALTMVGLEVEGGEDRYAHLADVRVARIDRVSPHPNADRLSVCEVTSGPDGGPVTVVCGAPNAEAGRVAPLARPGAVLADGGILERSVIRGVSSEGMLCSAAELGLGTDASGLMILDPDLVPGTPLAEALGLSDTVFEIGLTPNRPDCLSVIGIAREAAAIQGVSLTPPTISPPDGEGEITGETRVTIEAPDHCPRYAARLLTGITVGPSPDWLADRLRSVGQKPINNIVDVTNFVMLEMGQPLHAFDFDRLAGGRIVVRTASPGEPFTTLDGKERLLDGDMLMICDAEKPVAVGGVMGGLNSEIDETTTRVLIESAWFDPVSIRKTARRLGLATEASHRFERGVDPDGTVRALDRAAALMLEASPGGTLIRGVIDERPKVVGPSPIPVSVSATNRRLGTDLDGPAMAELLRSIDFDVTLEDSDRMTVMPPSFRVDVTRPEDISEEVARLWGYNRIPTTLPRMPAGAAEPDPRRTLRERVRTLLTGAGLTEAVSYSFVSRDAPDRLALAESDPRRSVVSILNPLSEEGAVMRTSLLPGLLAAAARNAAQDVRTQRLFEVGKIFLASGDADVLPDEPEMAAGLMTGARYDSAWHSQSARSDFFDIKGVVERLLDALAIPAVRFSRLADGETPYLRPGHAARIHSGEQAIGAVGEVHPETARRFALRETAFVFELDLEALAAQVPGIRQIRPIPRFPSVSRDISLIVEGAVPAGDVADALKSADVPGRELVETAFLFDLYEGEGIPAGRRSLSFRLVYRSPSETLSDERVNAIHSAIADHVLRQFNAELPR